MMSPVIATLADLVRINSVNPAYEGGRPESDVAQFVRQFASDHGIACWQQDVLKDRPNVILCVPGRDPSRRVVFEAHMDTASVVGMEIAPFEPLVRDGLLYGRGACDTKAGLAAMLHAVASLKRNGETPPCEIWVVAAADEEHGFTGVLRLCEGLRAEAAIVSEPTELRTVVATKGVLRWRTHTTGNAAHSSKPHLGVNAITHMSRVVLALNASAGKLAGVSHPLLGSPTLSIGTIRGGTQVNIVPDFCSIEVDRRLLPGEDPRQVFEQYRRLLADTPAELPGLEARMDPPMLEDLPLETPADSSVVLTAVRTLKDMGLDSCVAGVPYGSDASKLSRAGVPSIVLGPGSIDRAHAPVEYVECNQVDQAFEFYRNFMRSFH